MNTRKLLAVAAFGILSAPSFAAITVTSPAFASNGTLPNEFAYSYGSQCSGSNLSPPLNWTGIPAGTKSLSIWNVDIDGNNYLHWKVWNVDPTASGVDLNAAVITTGLQQGRNSGGTIGYEGSCPPAPNNHRYNFTVYALNTTFTNEPSLAEVTAATIESGVLQVNRSASSNVSWTKDDCLFSWGERNYAALLAPKSADGAGSSTLTPANTPAPFNVLAPFTYRFYATTGVYVGVSRVDNNLYLYDPQNASNLFASKAAAAADIYKLGTEATWLTNSRCSATR